MKNAQPVRRGKRGRVTIDVLAARKAAAAGTLSDADQATVELFLPGVLGKMGADLLALGEEGLIIDAVRLICK